MKSYEDLPHRRHQYCLLSTNVPMHTSFLMETLNHEKLYVHIHAIQRYFFLISLLKFLFDFVNFSDL